MLAVGKLYIKYELIWSPHSYTVLQGNNSGRKNTKPTSNGSGALNCEYEQ